MSLAATLPTTCNARGAQSSRYALVWLTVAVYWGISTLTRGALAAKALAAGQIEWGQLPAAFAIGAGYDLVIAFCIGAPFAVYLLLLPERFYRSAVHRAAIWTVLALPDRVKPAIIVLF